MPAPGCVPHRRGEGRGTQVRRVAALLTISLSLALGASGVAGGGTDPAPNECRPKQTPGSTPRRCVGPVTDESGGGGDVLTVVIGAVVGLTIAGVAFVIVRRQLASSGSSR